MNTETGYLKLSNTAEYLLPNSYLQHCCRRAAAGFTEDFVPDEECIRFLEGILPDAELRLWMQKFLGYCLTGSTREKLAVFLYASGNNGKTVFLQLMKNSFGDYYVGGDDKLICTSRWSSDSSAPTPNLASLAGATICLFDELKQGKKIDSAAFKQLTGGSPIKARKLRQDPFEFTPRCKIIIGCNDLPLLESAHDPALKIRIRVCPMTAVFNKYNKDKSIVDKVETQSWKNTFLYWCYEGLQYYLADGLDDFDVDTSIDESNMPRLMKLAMKDYFKEADEIGDFVMTYCEVTHDESDFVSFSDLYDLYVKEQKNSFAESKRSFGGKLRKYMDAHKCVESRKFIRAFNGERTLQRGYAGIRFYPDVD